MIKSNKIQQYFLNKTESQKLSLDPTLFTEIFIYQLTLNSSCILREIKRRERVLSQWPAL
jgi:hypothetical protein